MSELADLWYEPPSVQERVAMQGEISALRARVAQLEKEQSEVVEIMRASCLECVKQEWRTDSGRAEHALARAMDAIDALAQPTESGAREWPGKDMTAVEQGAFAQCKQGAASDEEAAQEIAPRSHLYEFHSSCGGTEWRSQHVYNGQPPLRVEPLYDAGALAQARAEGIVMGREDAAKIADNDPTENAYGLVVKKRIAAAIREAKP